MHARRFQVLFGTYLDMNYFNSMKYFESKVSLIQNAEFWSNCVVDEWNKLRREHF
jgi:hypothetical protein